MYASPERTKSCRKFVTTMPANVHANMPPDVPKPAANPHDPSTAATIVGPKNAGLTMVRVSKIATSPQPPPMASVTAN